VYGHGIPFFNPYHGMKTTLQNIEKAFRAGAKTAGLSLDHKDTPVNERWLPEMVEQSPLPIIAKGILSLENALFAVDAGVKGIAVSNRGGRILQSLPSGFEVIEEIKREIKDSVLLMVDGGVRSGEDVFKALSLGADLVLIGRPLFIFCAGGLEDGVSFFINKIKSELKEVMLLVGAKTVGNITRSMTKQY
jgi:isopentenyl diphosphate isomerase/L-lactate dehydrogenase-like FMN-dependent dehydrogenase